MVEHDRWSWLRIVLASAAATGGVLINDRYGWWGDILVFVLCYICVKVSTDVMLRRIQAAIRLAAKRAEAGQPPYEPARHWPHHRRVPRRDLH